MSIPYSFNPLGSNPSTEGGYIVFSDGVNEYKFIGNFDAMTNGAHMFENHGLEREEYAPAVSVSEWHINLPNLINGTDMFYGCKYLTTFKGDIPKITNHNDMFQNCSALTTFEGDVSSITNGNSMFMSSPLTSFASDLPNLTNGGYMFSNSSLDETSILRILNTIPTTSERALLHLGSRVNFMNSAEIASLLGTTTPIAANNPRTLYTYKGWSIIVNV